MEKSRYNTPLRTYTKTELAHLYNPDMTHDCALRTLRRWIIRIPELYDQLLQTGYLPQQRVFSPRQVAMLFHYLGEP